MLKRKLKGCKTRAKAVFSGAYRRYLANEAGDFYISDAVKIIIAVVLGALLLLALTGLFNGTVIPRITQEIEGLFGG